MLKSIDESPTSRFSCATRSAGLFPGMMRRFTVACTDPGITFERKPPLMIVGAIVLRMSEWYSGSLLTMESARAARRGSPLTTSAKNSAIGGALVHDNAKKNNNDTRENESGVSY